MTELKPCPFCGREAEARTCILNGYVYAHIACQACFGSGPTSGGRHSDTEAIKEAIEAWNHRAEESEES